MQALDTVASLRPRHPTVQFVREAAKADGGAVAAVVAREVLDVCGDPAVRVEVSTPLGVSVAQPPCPRSPGCRDGGDRYRGMGVTRAVDAVNRRIAPALLGLPVKDIASLDRLLLSFCGPTGATADDSTPARLAVFAVSAALWRAHALYAGQPLYAAVADAFALPHAPRIPVPSFSAVQRPGSADDDATDTSTPCWPMAEARVDLVPTGAACFSEALRVGVETAHAFGRGAAPAAAAGTVPVTAAMAAVTKACIDAGTHDRCTLGLHVGASSLFVPNDTLREEAAALAKTRWRRRPVKRGPAQGSLGECDHAMYDLGVQVLPDGGKPSAALVAGAGAGVGGGAGAGAAGSPSFRRLPSSGASVGNSTVGGFERLGIPDRKAVMNAHHFKTYLQDVCVAHPGIAYVFDAFHPSDPTGREFLTAVGATAFVVGGDATTTATATSTGPSSGAMSSTNATAVQLQAYATLSAFIAACRDVAVSGVDLVVCGLPAATTDAVVADLCVGVAATFLMGGAAVGCVVCVWVGRAGSWSARLTVCVVPCTQCGDRCVESSVGD